MESAKILEQLSRDELYSVYQFLLLESQSPEEIHRTDSKDHMIDILSRAMSQQDVLYCQEFFEHYDFYTVPVLKSEMVDALPDDLLFALFSIYLDDDLIPESHEQLVERLSASQYFLKEDARKFYLWFHFFRKRISIDDVEALEAQDPTRQTGQHASPEPGEWSQDEPQTTWEEVASNASATDLPDANDTTIIGGKSAFSDISVAPTPAAGDLHTTLVNDEMKFPDLGIVEDVLVTNEPPVEDDILIEVEIPQEDAAYFTGEHDVSDEVTVPDVSSTTSTASEIPRVVTNVIQQDSIEAVPVEESGSQTAETPSPKASIGLQDQSASSPMRTIEISAFDLENYILEADAEEKRKKSAQATNGTSTPTKPPVTQTPVQDEDAAFRTQRISVAELQDLVIEDHTSDEIKDIEESGEFIEELSEIVEDDEELDEVEELTEIVELDESDEALSREMDAVPLSTLKATVPPPPKEVKPTPPPQSNVKSEPPPPRAPSGAKPPPKQPPPRKAPPTPPKGKSGPLEGATSVAALLTPAYVDTLTELLYRASLLGGAYGRPQIRTVRIFFQKVLECVPIQLKRVRNQLKKLQAQDVPLVPPKLDKITELVPILPYSSRSTLLQDVIFLIGCTKLQNLERYRDFLTDLSVELRIDPADGQGTVKIANQFIEGHRIE